MQRIITYISDERFWREGKTADVWTITHFLFGVVGTLALLLLGSSPLAAFIAVLIAAVAWEVFEYAADIKERIGNRILDVAITLVGFVCGYFVSLISPQVAWTAVALLSPLWGLMLFVGWSASRRRMQTMRGQS